MKKSGSKALALATVAAYAAVAGRLEAVAQEHGAGHHRHPQATEQTPPRRFAIAAGTLDAVLEAYHQQSGVALRVELSKADLATLHSGGVAGTFHNDTALQELLAGTGLDFHFEGADRAWVGVMHKETVEVSANLPDSVNLSKFTEPLLDTPQTVNVVPQFVLHDEANRSLMDAVRNVPGISLAAGESGAQGDNLTIRGFTARNDIFLDGIRDFGSYYRDSFDFEQVEVLEGPAGVQFGRGSTGGAVNQESKQPAADKFLHAGVEFGTDATRRVTVDANEPLTDVAAGSAFRLNAVGTEGGVAGRPFAENRRFGIAPAVSFGMNSTNPVTLAYFHWTESDTPDYGLPWFFDRLAPGVDPHAYFGFPDTNFLRTNDDVITLKASRSFRDGSDVHTIGRWANYPRDAQITEPQICANPAASVPLGGWVTALPASAVNPNVACPMTVANFDPAKAVVNRNQLQIKSVEGDLWGQTEVSTRFRVAGVRSELVAGVEGGREVSNPIRKSYNITPTGSKSAVNTVPSTPLLNPDTGQAFSGTGYVLSVAHTSSKSVGLYFVDTLKLGRFVELSGGVRWDHFDTTYSLYQPNQASLPAGATKTAAVLNADGTPLQRVDQQPTYRAAFVVKPNTHGSVYFDYGTSFNPAAESLSLSIGLANGSAAPEENETYEAGVKWNFFHERLRAEGAVFQTEKDNARETDPTNSNNIVAAGSQRVRGVQASVVGQLPRGMNVIAGYAHMKSQTTSSKFFPVSVGYALANVPSDTFNFFVTRDVVKHVNAAFGGNYVAARTASSTVPFVPTSYSAGQTFAAGTAPCAPAATTATTCYQVLSTGMKQVPGYWVFNAMVKRPVNDHVLLQANVYNLTNAFYIDQPHPSHLIPGAGLTALIGMNFKW